jgi:hypothetical protein
VVCGRGDTKRPEDPVFNSGSVCSRASVEEEITIPGHYGILKGEGDRSIVSCQRFISRELMRAVPGARGAQTYLVVVESWRDRMMLRRPGGWQRSASSLMMHALLKLIVIHRCYVFMAILDSNIRRRQMSARSPRGPPRVVRSVSFAPHTRWMIDGVRASEPRSRRVQQASAQARAC